MCEVSKAFDCNSTIRPMMKPDGNQLSCILKWLARLALAYLGHLGRKFLPWAAAAPSAVDSNSSEDEAEIEPAATPAATTVPVSVNYHFTRRCNYNCGFCFHTAISSFVLPLEEAKRGLRMLQEAGMQKVNFSGGEPFLEQRGRLLGEMVRYCKETLGLPSVSIVSNGSLITEEWFQTYGEWLDILAVSCDSFDEATNKAIGRHSPRHHHLDKLYQISDWCTRYHVAFKINTVVNTHNWQDDMSEQIMELRPCRWKVFQCLLIGGENCGEYSLRHAETFVIADEQFRSFLDTHSGVGCLVPESNEKMRDSYLILDERMRFLDCTRGRKEPSRSILDVGVADAICASGFDERMFRKRGGVYQWSKSDIMDW